MQIRNTNTSIPVTVAINFDSNGTLYELYRATLYIGDTITYSEGVFLPVPFKTGGIINKKTSVRSPTANTFVISVVEHLLIPGLRVEIPVANTLLCYHAQLIFDQGAVTQGARYNPRAEVPFVGSGTHVQYLVGQFSANGSSVTSATFAAAASNVASTVPVLAINGPTTTGICILGGTFQHTTAQGLAFTVSIDAASAAGLRYLNGSWFWVWEPTG
jgi:hypothetical protein